MEQGDHRSLAERAQQYWDTRLHSLMPQSAEEYFAVLLDRALRAKQAGDYGISAAMSVRCPGFEIVSFGWNTVYSHRNPLGHAEANAIRHLSELIALPPGAISDSISRWTSVVDVLKSSANTFIRETNDSSCRSILYTTLEPCPMCSVAIITAGVNLVIVAAPDEWSGALTPEHLHSLPSAWPELAESQGLQVRLGSSDPSDSSTFMPPELTAMLSEAFLTGRDALDDEISRQGMLAASTVCAAFNGPT